MTVESAQKRASHARTSGATAHKPKNKPQRGRPPRKSARSEVLRQKLITVALEEFNREFYDNIPMELLAKRAEILRTGIFYYFPSKAHILYHVFDRYLDGRLAQTEALMKIPDPRERLIALIRDNVYQASRYRILNRAWAFNRPQLDDPIADQVREKNRKWVQLHREAVELAQKAGVLPKADSFVVISMLFATSTLLYAWQDEDRYPAEVTARSMLATLGLS